MSLQEKQIATVVNWLENRVRDEQLNVRFYDQNASLSGKYLRLPAASGSVGSVWERVEALQRVEDAWNDQEPEPDITVSLVPVDDVSVVAKGGG